MKTIKNIFLSGALLCMAVTTIHGMDEPFTNLGQFKTQLVLREALREALRKAIGEALPDGQLDGQIIVLAALQKALPDGQMADAEALRALQKALPDSQMTVLRALEVLEALRVQQAAL